MTQQQATLTRHNSRTLLATLGLVTAVVMTALQTVPACQELGGSDAAVAHMDGTGYTYSTVVLADPATDEWNSTGS
jgi:hypothetical protein